MDCHSFTLGFQESGYVDAHKFQLCVFESAREGNLQGKHQFIENLFNLYDLFY